MRHLAIIDETCGAEQFGNMLSGSFDFSTVANMDNLSVQNVPDAFVVNADLIGDKLPELLMRVRKNRALTAPVILTTRSSDSSYQESLCRLEADDILVLPLCRELIIKRISSIIESFSAKNSSSDLCFGFDELINTVTEKNKSRGAFCVGRNDFTNIYRFIMRGLERSDINAQVVLFTLNCSNNEYGDDVMTILAGAAQLCLRRGDISSVLSKNQVVILLVGANDDGAHLVANRIVSSFYSECDDDDYELNYDIREINMKNKK